MTCVSLSLAEVCILLHYRILIPYKQICGFNILFVCNVTQTDKQTRSMHVSLFHYHFHLLYKKICVVSVKKHPIFLVSISYLLL